jgi:hypothetical protein
MVQIESESSLLQATKKKKITVRVCGSLPRRHSTHAKEHEKKNTQARDRNNRANGNGRKGRRKKKPNESVQ